MRFALPGVVFALVAAMTATQPAGVRAQSNTYHWPSPTNRLFPADPPIIIAAPAAQVAAAERIREALETPVTLHANDQGLQDVIRTLCDPLGIPWFIDHRSFDDAGIQRDFPINVRLPRVSLRAALDSILRPIDLGWCIRNETLTIATSETLHAALETRVYPVADLVEYAYDDGTLAHDFDALIAIITANIEPVTWDEVGGPGSIREFHNGHLLVISQVDRIHDQISLLLSAIRKTKGFIAKAPPRLATTRHISSEPAAKSPQWTSKYLSAQDASRFNNGEESPKIDLVHEREIAVRTELRALLDKPIFGDFQSVALNDVVSQLAAKTNAPWRLDLKSLEDAGLQGNSSIDYAAQGITLRSALNQMLRQLDLVCVMRGESFVITTPESASGQIDVRVYYVGDLVAVEGDPSGQGDYDSLIEVITSTISPTTWDEVGGPGSIREFASAHSLIFSQTQEVHEQTELLLGALRIGKAIATAKGEMPKKLSLAQPTKPAPVERSPKRTLHISNQQPDWRLPRVHN